MSVQKHGDNTLILVCHLHTIINRTKTRKAELCLICVIEQLSSVKHRAYITPKKMLMFSETRPILVFSPTLIFCELVPKIVHGRRLIHLVGLIF